MKIYSTKKIFGKVFLKLIISILLILMAFFIQMSIMQKNSIIDNFTSNAKTIADSITYTNINAFLLNDETKILEFIFSFVKDNKKIEKIIISRKKGDNIIISSSNWGTNKKLDKHYDKFKQNKNSFEIVYSKEKETEVFRYGYCIKFSDILWGWLIIDLSLDEYKSMINNMYNQFIFIAIIMILISIFIAYLIAKTFSSPIIKLNNTTQKIFSGDLSVRSDIVSDDEIGELSKSFNQMVNSLEKSQIELRNSHNQLEKRVKKRTEELGLVNKELIQKSKELEELNENLEFKVEEEIKKQKEQEQLLIQQSRLAAMGEMIGNIAHQWRQPLNALGLTLQNIQFAYETETLDSDFMNRSVEKANLLTNSMSKTIDDFRNFFKPNKEKEIFNLNECINESLKLIDSSYSHHNIKIKLDNLKENITLNGFPNELSQVFLNILTNAKDALIENNIKEPFVHIDIFEEKNSINISIEDNAGGIPSEIIKKVFDPYFTTKEEGKGTGIGLYMSKTIIENNMNGKLEVINTHKGAKFIIGIKRA